MRTNRINTLLVVSILLTIASGVITHFSVKESEERVAIVLHTQKVIQESADLLNFVKDTEAAYRNILISPDEANMMLLDTAGSVAARKLNQLQILVSDPTQLDMLENEISPLIEKKLNALRRSARAEQSSLSNLARIEGLLHNTTPSNNRSNCSTIASNKF
jgi:CHASE3 domain sensor protein